MEGADLSLDRLEYVTRAVREGTLADQVFTAFLGKVPREDCITYAADFFLDLEDVRWTVISGVVNEMMVISVRNLGYSRNAGDFVKKPSAASAAPAAIGRWPRPSCDSTSSRTSSAPSTRCASAR